MKLKSEKNHSRKIRLLMLNFVLTLINIAVGASTRFRVSWSFIIISEKYSRTTGQPLDAAKISGLSR
jgi:hypothetical protein